MANCDPCGMEWEAESEAHCASCHEHFSSDAGFDAHRMSFGCVHPATLTRKPFKRVARKGRTVWMFQRSVANWPQRRGM